MIFRIFLILGSLAFALPSLQAQSISKEEIQPLFKLLIQQKWDSAFTEANDMIRNHPEDSGEYMQISRYAVILSAAGRVAEGKIKHLDLREIIWPFIGKRLLMPVHHTTTDTNNISFNLTHLKNNNGKVFAETVVKSTKGNTVLTFENFAVTESFEVEEFDNALTRCSGVLYRVEINPYQDDMWVVRLFMVDSAIRKVK